MTFYPCGCFRLKYVQCAVCQDRTVSHWLLCAVCQDRAAGYLVWCVVWQGGGGGAFDALQGLDNMDLEFDEDGKENGLLEGNNSHMLIVTISSYTESYIRLSSDTGQIQERHDHSWKVVLTQDHHHTVVHTFGKPNRISMGTYKSPSFLQNSIESLCVPTLLLTSETLCSQCWLLDPSFKHRVWCWRSVLQYYCSC